MRTVTSLTVGLLLVSVTSLSAQEPPPIEAGSRIRVTAPSTGVDKLVGICLSTSGDSLRMQADEQASPMTISLADVTRLEVSQGRKSNTLRGLGIGFLVGAVAGGLLATQVDVEEGLDPGPEELILYGAVVGGAAFGAIGAGIGALSKSERWRWKEVPLDHLRVSIVPLFDGRFALGVSVAF